MLGGVETESGDWGRRNRIDFGCPSAPAPLPARPAMHRSFITKRLLPLLLTAAVLVPGLAVANTGRSTNEESLRRTMAARLLQHSGVALLDFHVSGRRDEATAKHNLVQTASGKPAKRSYYSNAPGGVTQLDTRMLRAMLILVSEGYTFRVTEFAGGSHSSNSRHYQGVAFDIDTLNGQRISYGHPSYRTFLKRCRQLGATEILGPGTRGHSRHLHVAWPRK